MEPVADADAPLLWESCWTPLLAALADGVADPRKEVMSRAFCTLLDCLNDQHTHVAPAVVVGSAISESLIPSFSHLRVALQAQLSRALLGPVNVMDNDGIEKLIITGLHCLSKLISENMDRLSPHLLKILKALLNFSQFMFIEDATTAVSSIAQLVENIAFDTLTTTMVQCRQQKLSNPEEAVISVFEDISISMAIVQRRLDHL